MMILIPAMFTTGVKHLRLNLITSAMETKETLNYSFDISFMNPRFDLEEVEIDKDSMVMYNTKSYWYLFFCTKTKRGINQYGRVVLQDATKYLISRGLMDENFNQIKYFEE